MFPTRISAFLAVCTGMLLVAPPALAADSGESTPLNLPSVGQSQATSTGGSSLVRTFVGLAIVLAVIYGLYWVLKQVKASKESAASGTSLESVATIPLGPNRSLHLVRAGRELVLVGVAEHGVTPIRTYTEDEAIDLGLIAEEDAELDGTGRAGSHPASRAGAVRWLDRLKDRTVRR